jgi:hypothetical protein
MDIKQLMANVFRRIKSMRKLVPMMVQNQIHEQIRAF